jgi:hypothetical protein
MYLNTDPSGHQDEEQDADRLVQTLPGTHSGQYGQGKKRELNYPVFLPESENRTSVFVPCPLFDLLAGVDE